MPLRVVYRIRSFLRQNWTNTSWWWFFTRGVSLSRLSTLRDDWKGTKFSSVFQTCRVSLPKMIPESADKNRGLKLLLQIVLKKSLDNIYEAIPYTLATFMLSSGGVGEMFHPLKDANFCLVQKYHQQFAGCFGTPMTWAMTFYILDPVPKQYCTILWSAP